MNIPSILIAIFWCLIPYMVSAQTDSLKVLFVGNSYTNNNNLADECEKMAASMGKTIRYGTRLSGGFTLMRHATNPATYTAIHSDNWDVVVFQAQSQEPSFSPNQVASETLPYAQQLADSVKAANPCSQVMFFMTWGRKNGDASNCAAYPPICTYAGMQKRLRESYLLMANQNNGMVAPVGAAWQWVRAQHPGIELYNPDESHPSLYGSYLATCVFYASLFRSSPHDSLAYIRPGLDSAQCRTLQLAAETIVLPQDSVNLWRIAAHLPMADFSHIANEGEVQFTPSPQNLSPLTYSWDFGDGNSSLMTQPVHTYDSTGAYTVSLVISNACFQDTVSKVVEVEVPVSTAIDPQLNVPFQAYPNPVKDMLHLQVDNPNPSMKIEVLDLRGRRVFQSAYARRMDLSALPTGIYQLLVIAGEKRGSMRLVKE